MIERFEVTVPAPSGKQQRNAYVYLPKTYDGAKRFPVLYLFDGQTVFFDETSPFGDSLRLGDALDELHAELIAVAVDCDKIDRLTEYSPWPFTSKFGSSGGKGEAYMEWLTKVLKQHIDEVFLTLPDRFHTFIMGSSMGGLMTLYALCRYPEIFGGGAALSPSLWVDPAACREMILQADWGKDPPVIYLDYGEKELLSHGGRQREALFACHKTLLEKCAPYTFRLIKDGTHSEASWRSQIPVFLKALALI